MGVQSRQDTEQELGAGEGLSLPPQAAVVLGPSSIGVAWLLGLACVWDSF